MKPIRRFGADEFLDRVDQAPDGSIVFVHASRKLIHDFGKLRADQARAAQANARMISTLQ